MWGWIRAKISRQLLAIFLFAVIVPFALFYRYWDGSYNRTLEDSFVVNTELGMNQMALHLNSYFANMEQNLNYLSGNTKFQQLIRKLNDGTYPVSNEREFSLFREIDDTIKSMVLLNPRTYLQSAVFLRNGIVVRNTSRYVPRPEDPDGDELDLMNQNMKASKIRYKFHEGDPGWFTVSKTIVDYSDGSVLGLARIADDTGEIESIFANMSENRASLFLLDEKQNVLLKGGSTPAFEVTPDIWNSRTPGGKSNLRTIGNEEYLIVIQPLTDSQMYVGALIPYQEWTKRISDLRRFTLLMAAWTILVSGCIYILYSLNLTRSIAGLSLLQKKLRQGDLAVRHKTKRIDEVEQLGQSFNAMAEEMQTLLDKVLRAELLSKEAEVRMLQSQMDPHFLYNTLETINMMAIASKAPDISRMVVMMAKFYRLMVNIHRSDLLLPLRTEYETTQLYLNIQKIRMGDRLRFESIIEDGLERHSIIKMTLQPLVENALLHGIGPKPEGGLVRIAAETIVRENGEEAMRIAVSDDGVGMMPGELEKLRLKLADPTSRNSIGLHNAHWRIRLHFGEPYGLQVDSKNNAGTTVTLLIPIVLGGDGHESSHRGG